MRKIKIVLLLLILILPDLIIAQGKSLIDIGMLDTWPSLSSSRESIALSSDGNYVAYVISRQPVGQRTLVLQALNGQWKKTIVCKSPKILFFNKNNKQLCWQQGDSVHLESMGSSKSRLLGVTNTISYPINTKGQWLFLLSDKQDHTYKLLNLVTGREQAFKSIKGYRWLTGGTSLLLTTIEGGVKLLNLVTYKEQFFASVKNYAVSSDDKIILLNTEKGSGVGTNLKMISVQDGKSIDIWKGHAGEQPGNYAFDKAKTQLAFTVRSSDGRVSIWHFKAGEASATLKTDDKTTGLPISDITSFSSNGRWLFFKVRKTVSQLSEKSTTTAVDIWTYRDEMLNPAQSENIGSFKDYAAVVELNTNKVQLLEQSDDERVGQSRGGDYFVLYKGGSSSGKWWPHSEPFSVWLVSLISGKKEQIQVYDGTESFSPSGHWLLYWNSKLGQYFSKNIRGGKTVSLTKSLAVSVADDIEQLENAIPVGKLGWYVGDAAILIYDTHDIWKLDPSGLIPPINITGGYGRKHDIKLRLVYRNTTSWKGNEELFLVGYDVNTRFNGFFKIRLDRPGEPELLTMGPYTYFQTAVNQQSFGDGMLPLTGGDGKNKRWIVMRESANEYPNFFVSKDLKKFTPLTDLQPQKAYNWLKSEAVSWKMYDGQINHGVLYKPESFDPNKKYPIIFNYYEKYSHRCYQFPMPGLTTDNINIPWFVSRGYLVFTPDIQYSIASKPGGMTISEAAYNAVVSVAECLSQRPYIDKERMAIQGHSFGGHETNALITQTNLFAAASEMAGYSDLISAYLTLVTSEEGKDLVEYAHKLDHSNQRMGATPWERPDLYQRNSPVINADKVKTPLFIVHNKMDGSVNFRQGLEMYMALRRLGKPCWLLQYDNSGHILGDKNDAVDYTIRLTQYFDHYLKGEPAPQWMTKNTLASYKGKNNLYKLDPKGNCSNDCEVCRGWNIK